MPMPREDVPVTEVDNSDGGRRRRHELLAATDKCGGAFSSGAAGHVNHVNANTSHVLGKRRADESSLNDDDRFAKRLNRLSLDHDDKNNYYITGPDEIEGNSPVERMSVDETPSRVYIHNLDDELAEIETNEQATSEAEKLIFLPDIDRYFSKIPHHVLSSEKSASASSPGSEESGTLKKQELVLYTMPDVLSLGMPTPDARKTIEDRVKMKNTLLEARRRALEKAAEETRHADMKLRYTQPDVANEAAVETAHGYAGGYEALEQSTDAASDSMDVD